MISPLLHSAYLKKDETELNNYANMILSSAYIAVIQENGKYYFSSDFQDQILFRAVCMENPHEPEMEDKARDLTLAILQGKVTGLSRKYFGEKVLEAVKNQAETYKWDQILEELGSTTANTSLKEDEIALGISTEEPSNPESRACIIS